VSKQFWLGDVKEDFPAEIRAEPAFSFVQIQGEQFSRHGLL
jgi:hypothetical protein